ncbi:MAG: HEAT repeat domain-containing protein [Balneolaceae bacterium]|nr:HEAT repeat domain-containing protein [Balneolaceae bacterium]MCH8549239.1 HEAT repeat domain-containing protein [Balneolaceae bacterium]
MHKIIRSSLLTALIITAVTMIQIQAQDNSWDVELFPEMPYSFEHLDAEVNISETGVIEGDILYTIRFLDQDADSIVLDAPGIEILRTVINDESAEYYQRSDQLVVYTAREYDRDDEIALRIQYRAEPRFGLHESAKGTFWTSNLPRSTSHWLPVKDHPLVEFSLDLVITHPAGQNVISNGRMGDTEVVSVDEELTTFSANNRKVTPGGLTLVSGNIERLATTMESNGRSHLSDDAASHFQRRSDSHIHLWSETSAVDTSSVIRAAGEAFAKMSRETGRTYPFRDLNIVVLEDSAWETRPYGSGTLYLFIDQGSIEEQAHRGVMSQWIGAKLREPRWSDSEAIHLLQAYWLDRVYGTVSSPDQDGYEEKRPYHTYTTKSLSQWQKSLENDDWSRLRRVLDENSERFLSSDINTLSWNSLADIVYNISGRTFFDIPNMESAASDDSQEESIREYLAQMEWDEDERTVRITFTALGESIDELVTVQATEFTFLDEKEHEITFTGESDAIELNVSSNIENLKLHTPDRDNLILSEEKPFSFWIYQLREDEDADRRKEAARALSGFPENPDLQLALTDMFSVEENPEVYAEIVRSLGAITAGASGTDQIFMDRATNRYPIVVREAALESLAYFRDNDSVISRLRSVAGQSSEGTLRRTAIRSLSEVTSLDAFRNISENLITRDEVLSEVPMILQLLAEKGEVEAAVQFSFTFLAEGFPYSVRSEVLELVLRHDESRSAWEDRLPGLLADRDPRVRYRATEALERVGSQVRGEIVADALAEEHDERVRRKLSDNR